MATIIKSITAGPFHERVMVQVSEETLAPKRRGARSNPTPPAQVFYNNKRSWKELRLWIYGNFGKNAYVVTTTYTDENLPPDKDSALKGPWKRYVRKLRGSMRKRGEELEYICATEGFHGRSTRNEFWEPDGDLENMRLHHHFIVNAHSRETLEEIRSLWPGGGYVRIEPFVVRYGTALARYMTKEAREFGRAKPGDRSWSKSANLKKYQEEYISVPMNGMAFTPPPGAVDYEAFYERNPHGFADCVGDRYLLFDREPDPGYSYTKGPGKKGLPYN